MSKTLATSGTIPIWQGFYKPYTSEDEPDEVRILLALGPDMDGHLNTAHGGVAALMLDEAMGTMAGMHKEPGKAIFTAYMHVDYKKPVPTPSVCLIRVTFDSKRSAKRKIYVNASLENGDGVVYTTAESLFLEAERKHHHGPKM
jgi:thioesterase superfamily protein 4